MATEADIRLHLLTAKDGFVDYIDASMWLATYPFDRYEQSHEGRFRASTAGTGPLGRELDRLHGPKPYLQDREFNSDFRRGTSGLQVSIRALRGAAVAAGNVPLVQVIDEAMATSEKVLNAPEPSSLPTHKETELQHARQDRRLRWFEENGGSVARTNEKWVLGGRGLLARLAEAERDAKRAMSDPRDVSADLKAAADRRRTQRLMKG